MEKWPCLTFLFHTRRIETIRFIRVKVCGALWMKAGLTSVHTGNSVQKAHNLRGIHHIPIHSAMPLLWESLTHGFQQLLICMHFGMQLLQGSFINVTNLLAGYDEKHPHLLLQIQTSSSMNDRWLHFLSPYEMKIWISKIQWCLTVLCYYIILILLYCLIHSVRKCCLIAVDTWLCIYSASCFTAQIHGQCLWY